MRDRIPINGSAPIDLSLTGNGPELRFSDLRPLQLINYWDIMSSIDFNRVLASLNVLTIIGEIHQTVHRGDDVSASIAMEEALKQLRKEFTGIPAFAPIVTRIDSVLVTLDLNLIKGVRACPITLFTPQVDSGRVVLDGAIAGRDIV